MTMTATQDTQTSQWTLDAAHSEVEFAVRHMMISTVKGHFPELSGTVHLDESDFSDSSVSVEMEAASVDTRNADRDAHLRSGEFFDVETFPKLTFRSRSVEGSPDSFTVRGDLTIKGVTREVVLKGEELGRGTDPWGNPRVGFRAEGKLNRKDYGLTWNQALEAGGVLVGDEVRLRIEVQAIPSSSD